MNSALLFRILFLIASLTLGAAVVHAEDLGALKQRMDARQSAVDALKDRQVVGENNRGFLEPRAEMKPEEQTVVSEENTDRRAVYAAIAAQTGSSAGDVGRARAQKIALNSKRGVWIQEPDGNWRQK